MKKPTIVELVSHSLNPEIYCNLILNLLLQIKSSAWIQLKSYALHAVLIPWNVLFISASVAFWLKN